MSDDATVWEGGYLRIDVGPHPYTGDTVGTLIRLTPTSGDCPATMLTFDEAAFMVRDVIVAIGDARGRELDAGLVYDAVARMLGMKK